MPSPLLRKTIPGVDETFRDAVIQVQDYEIKRLTSMLKHPEAKLEQWRNMPHGDYFRAQILVTKRIIELVTNITTTSLEEEDKLGKEIESK